MSIVAPGRAESILSADKTTMFRRAAARRQPEPRSGGFPLGTVAKFVSPGRVAPSSPGVLRFMRQAAARELMLDVTKPVQLADGEVVQVPAERVCYCLRRPVPDATEVEVWRDPRHEAAHYKRLFVCGSVWMCAVCAARISEVRREELSEAVRAWGGQIALITLTLQHSSSDALSGLLEALLEAARKLRQGKSWQQFEERFGVEFESRGRVRRRVGTIRALEVTYGNHGFHPHLHLLAFVAGGVDMDAFSAELRARWSSAVAKVDRYAHPQWGCDVRHADAEVADYVAKFGKEPKWTVAHELAKGASKATRGEGWSMPGLLEAYALGDEQCGWIWKEYARWFKGKRQLVWSDGLRALLLPGRAELLDEQIVEAPTEEAIFLAALSLDAWRVVVANDVRFELLEVASSGGRAELERFFLALGITKGVRYESSSVELSP